MASDGLSDRISPPCIYGQGQEVFRCSYMRAVYFMIQSFEFNIILIIKIENQTVFESRIYGVKSLRQYQSKECTEFLLLVFIFT